MPDDEQDVTAKIIADLEEMIRQAREIADICKSMTKPAEEALKDGRSS